MENTVSDVTEPVLVPEDYETVGAGVNMRLLTTPLRYRGIGTGQMVTGAAFDRLRDAYLKAEDNTYLDKCVICSGDVLSQQQFLRTEVGDQFPALSHMTCEERRPEAKLRGDLKIADTKIRLQARTIQELETVLSNVRMALGNFGHTIAAQILDKEPVNAVSERKVESSRIFEHPYGGQSREATETSSGDSPLESRSGAGEDESAVQERQGAIGYDIDGYEVVWSERMKLFVRTGKMKPATFRVDDVIGGVPSKSILANVYKWPPDFKKFEDGHSTFTVQPHVFNYASGPYNQPHDDESLEEKYALKADTIHCSPDRIGASCE
jgi:hypothetical protein